MRSKLRSKLLLVGVLAVVVVLAAVVAGCSATAGGWIPSKADDGKATFGFNAKFDNDQWTGNLSYTDHNYPMGDLKMVNLQGVVLGGVGNYIWGTYEPKPKGDGGTFRVYLNDDGQPRAGADEFSIRLYGGVFNGYRNSGELGGGNVVVNVEQ